MRKNEISHGSFFLSPILKSDLNQQNLHLVEIHYLLHYSFTLQIPCNMTKPHFYLIKVSNIFVLLIMILGNLIILTQQYPQSQHSWGHAMWPMFEMTS